LRPKSPSGQEKGEERIGNTVEPFDEPGDDFRRNPEGRVPFGPLALLLVAHDRIDHIAPRASPAAKMRKRRGHGDNEC
jgi:hypothetical protein